MSGGNLSKEDIADGVFHALHPECPAFPGTPNGCDTDICDCFNADDLPAKVSELMRRCGFSGDYWDGVDPQGAPPARIEEERDTWPHTAPTSVICSQCGEPISAPACGPTHAANAARGPGLDVGEKSPSALKAAYEWIKVSEWDGTDASCDPLCSGCGRDQPDYDLREAADYDRTEHHNTDCRWLALMVQIEAALGRASSPEKP